MPERQRSSQANVALAQKADQFNQLVSTAAASDETIRRKYRDCSDLIERLAGSNVSALNSYVAAFERAEQSSQADIEALLPQSSGTQRQSPQQVELSRQLRQLMEDLEQVSARRHNLVSDAKRMAMGDEIRPLVLREAGGLTSRAHGQPSLVEAAHFEPLFEQQLQKYDMYLSKMSQSEKEQQCLLQQAEVRFHPVPASLADGFCIRQLAKNSRMQKRLREVDEIEKKLCRSSILRTAVTVRCWEIWQKVSPNTQL